MKRRRRITVHARSNHALNLQPPAWVADVVAEVRAFAGVPSKRLLIMWRNGSGKLSSGHAKSSGEIVITAGSCEFDQGDILLHELAHWLLPRGTAHRMRFWRLYWRLVDHFGIDKGKCFASASYRSKAVVAYREIWS